MPEEGTGIDGRKFGQFDHASAERLVRAAVGQDFQQAVVDEQECFAIRQLLDCSDVAEQPFPGEGKQAIFAKVGVNAARRLGSRGGSYP